MTLLTTEGGGDAGGNSGGTSGGGSGSGSGSSGAGSGTGGGAGGSSGAGNGGAAPSWRDSLPEDIRGNATLGKFSDLNSLAKSYIEIQGLVGKKGVFPPGEKATPEQWKEFAKNIGQPEFDKFAVKTPEGRQMNTSAVDGFRKMAHENGLMPHQAQAALDFYINQENASLETLKTTQANDLKTQQDALKKEWGDGYDKQVALARLAVKEVGGEDFQKHLEKSGMGNDVNLIRTMAKVGALLGEDKLRGEGGGSFGQTPAEIQNEIDKIRGDLKHPFFDKAHPGHAHANKQMDALYQKLYRKKA